MFFYGISIVITKSIPRRITEEVHKKINKGILKEILEESPNEIAAGFTKSISEECMKKLSKSARSYHKIIQMKHC